MERLALDTTFLIDLQREHASPRKKLGAIAFLRERPTCELSLPVTALAEYLEGFDAGDQPAARNVLAGVALLETTEAVALRYASVARELRRAGRLIGTNDLWIGCTALTAHLPLVTRNADELRRIPGLQVVSY